MREQEIVKQSRIENIFRMTDPEEISKPQCFKHLYWSQEWIEQTHITVVASSVLGHDNNEDHIRAMQAKYEAMERLP